MNYKKYSNYFKRNKIVISKFTSKQNKLIYLLLFFYFFFSSNKIFAQSNPFPCSEPNVYCVNGGGNGIITSFGTKNIIYTSPGRSMPFWVAFGDTITNSIDTSSNSTFLISQKSGPGQMTGLPGLKSSKYIYFNTIEFTQFGDYEVIINRNNFSLLDTFNFKVVPEVEFCSSAPGGQCANNNGNEVFAKPSSSNVIPVDAVFPITVGVIDSLTQFIDPNFVGTIYVEKISGPGSIYGTLSMSGKGWFTFNNIRFDKEGIYEIYFYEESKTDYKSDTLSVEVVATNSIKKTSSPNHLSIFPNPFNDQLFIYNLNNYKDITLKVFNSIGELVLKINRNGKQENVILNTKLLKPGIYILHVNSAQDVIIQNKVIIKH